MLRAAVGAALTFKTESVLRAVARDAPPTGPLLLFARTVGIRDLAFGLGALAAARSDPPSDGLSLWLWAWLANEVADVIAAATASRHVGRAGAFVASIAPLPLVAADIRALRSLRRMSPEF